MRAKRKYDAKRKRCPERLRKERHRSLARKLDREGWCHNEHCGVVGKTVLHHVTYHGNDSHVVELCYPCHRAEHPRPMPNGEVV